MVDHIESEDVDDTAWFLAGRRGQEAGPRLIGLCRSIRMRQSTLATNTDQCMSVFQYGGDAKDRDPTDHVPIEDTTVSFNHAQNTVETVHARVCKSKITIMPLTSGGGYLQRHRSKQLGKCIEGVFDDNDLDVIEEDAMLDALTTDHGAGAAMVIECEDEIKIKHIPIEDVWFDEAETRQRKPRCCYYMPKDGIDKYECAELYGSDDDAYPGLVGTASSRRAAILKAAGAPELWRLKSPESRHRVDIFEAWHLPSGKVEEADEEYEDEDGETKTRRIVKHDGRHVVAVNGENGTLIDEPWDGKGGFPILLMVPRPRRRNIWGLSMMRELIAPQREHEKLTAKIQDQNQKMGVSGFYASKQMQVDVREITAGTFGAGFVVEAEGPNPPTPFVPEPVAQGTYQYKNSIPAEMRASRGVSEMSAASQVPAGLSNASGKALQVFDDSEDVRNLPYHRARERFRVGISWIVVHAARRITARNKEYKAKYRGKYGLELVDWAKVLEDAEEFVLKVFPIGALSQQPSARFEQLTELLNAEAITVEQFKRLFDIPDLEAENEIDSADTDIIDRNLDVMVIEGKYNSPEPTDNLAKCIERASKFHNLCRLKDVPEPRRKLVLSYIEDAKSLQDQIAAAAAAKAAVAAAPPPAPGGPLTPPDGAMPPPMPPGPPAPPPGEAPPLAA